MRHGANIPDIRALSGSLTSINQTLSAAFPETEPYTGLATVRFGNRVKVLDLDTERATIYNPQEITVDLSTRYGTFARLEPFASVSLQLGGGREVYANAVDGVGTLVFEAERNLAGAIVGALDVVELATNDFGGPYFTGGRAIYFNSLIDGAFSSVRSNGIQFDYDFNADAGIDGDQLREDLVKGKPWVLVIDENTGDIYSVNPRDEEFENVAQPEAYPGNLRLQSIKTPRFEGYVYCATDGSGDAYVYDANWDLLLTVAGTELITADQREGRDSLIYSSDHILLRDLNTQEQVYIDLVNLTFTTIDEGFFAVAYEDFGLATFSGKNTLQRVFFDGTTEEVDFGIGPINSFSASGLLLFDTVSTPRILADPVSGQLSSGTIYDNGDAFQYDVQRIWIVNGSTLEVRNLYKTLYTVDLPTDTIFGSQIRKDSYTNLISLLDFDVDAIFYIGTLTETWNPTANL